MDVNMFQCVEGGRPSKCMEKKEISIHMTSGISLCL